jgi:ubiquinone/menaquinone biosynthesis C-methylase UbiE
MGYDAIGIDYSSRMIEVAKSINPEIEYYVRDVRYMDCPDRSFDYALFSFNGLILLETYKERVIALQEINRVLKPEGMLFFTTPFLDNKLTLNYWEEKIKQYGKPLDKFTKEELIELGNEVIDERDIKFHIHIPFISEIQEMLHECDFITLFAGRRLDVFPEEKIEDELDDNYLWVVMKSNVQL